MSKKLSRTNNGKKVVTDPEVDPCIYQTPVKAPNTNKQTRKPFTVEEIKMLKLLVEWDMLSLKKVKKMVENAKEFDKIKEGIENIKDSINTVV